MLKKTLESKLLKIEKKALKDNKKDYLLMVKETKKAKSWDAFGECWDGAHYVKDSKAKRAFALRSTRLGRAKKENDLKKFKEVFIKLLEKRYKEDIKKFGIRWAKVWAAARSAEPAAIGWKETAVGSNIWGTKWETRAAVVGGTNRGAGEFSVAFGNCNSGCGYDKPSTATANALNQIRQALGVALRTKLETGGRCYGLYFSPEFGALNFSGGVGSSCFENIFKLAGYRSAGISFDGVVNLIKK